MGNGWKTFYSGVGSTALPQCSQAGVDALVRPRPAYCVNVIILIKEQMCLLKLKSQCNVPVSSRSRSRSTRGSRQHVMMSLR